MQKNTLLVLGLVGAGAYLYLNRKPSGDFGYITPDGHSITTVTCGEQIGFDVPGYDRVWLELIHDNMREYDAPFHIPMPIYTVNCTDDPGSYVANVYQIGPGEVKGSFIGRAVMSVSAA